MSAHSTQICGIIRFFAIFERSHRPVEAGSNHHAVTTHEVGTLLGQLRRGMISVVGDLPIGHPNEGVADAAAGRGEGQCGTIDAISDIARGDGGTSPSPVRDNPRIGHPREIPRSVRISNDRESR
jgi:hypothetical protein